MHVIVVGAGIIGCAVAHELSARGAAVRVIDMRGVGEGATRASAGVLCPHIEGHAAPLLALGVRSLELYDRFVERVRADAGVPIGYRRSGTLEVALTPEEAVQLQIQAQRHAAAGVDHRLLDPREARALEPQVSAQVTAALLVPAHGYVAAAALTSALARAAAARGARFEAGAAVRRIDPEAGCVRVTLDVSHHDADAVVLAAGSWSGGLAVGPGPPPVKPIRGQLLHLAFEAPPADRVVWGSQCYLVPWEDGSMLVGATVEDVGFDESATAAGVRDLLESACELLPACWHARFVEVRVGLRPAAADEMPIVGPSATVPGLFYATGHYRNGVLLAPLTASTVADLVLDGRAAPELALTTPARFGL